MALSWVGWKVRRHTTGVVYGPLPKGCVLCGKGLKLVLFVTGRCPFSCFYCPIALEKKGKDVMFANERPVKSFEDIVAEVELTGAKGAGITGGDPLTRKDLPELIKKLKENFGSNFHVHVYTRITKLELLEKLYEAGVDEIRFHFALPPKDVVSWDWDVGAEIPAVPSWERAIKKFILLAMERGLKFVNLNELEFSASNYEELVKRGFKPTEAYTVKGSEEMALKLVKWAAEQKLTIAVHYCSARVKLQVQLRRRYLRAAKRIAKKYEVITGEGTVVVGIMENRPEVINFLRKHRFSFDIVGQEIRTSPKAVELFGKGKIIEYLPTYDRRVVEVQEF